MGKARSYEIIEYRKKIISEICKSKELVKLLGCENDPNPAKAIPWKYVFPHEHVPDVVTKTERFINFDIAADIDYRNNVYKNLTITFFLLCHIDVVRYEEDGREFLWYDRVTCELDNIFTENDFLGVGKMALNGNYPYVPKYEFRGRRLTFVVKDFTNGLRYGK